MERARRGDTRPCHRPCPTPRPPQIRRSDHGSRSKAAQAESAPSPSHPTVGVSRPIGHLRTRYARHHQKLTTRRRLQQAGTLLDCVPLVFGGFLHVLLSLDSFLFEFFQLVTEEEGLAGKGARQQTKKAQLSSFCSSNSTVVGAAQPRPRYAGSSLLPCSWTLEPWSCQSTHKPLPQHSLQPDLLRSQDSMSHSAGFAALSHCHHAPRSLQDGLRLTMQGQAQTRSATTRRLPKPAISDAANHAQATHAPLKLHQDKHTRTLVHFCSCLLTPLQVAPGPHVDK